MVRNLLVGIIIALARAVAYLVPDKPAKTLNLAGTALATSVVVRMPRGSLRVIPGTRKSSYVLRPDRHEPDMLEYIDALPGGACFWDIGANVGLYSMYAALPGDVQVLAFEPSAASYAALNRHIEINDMQSLVSAYAIAFGDRTTLGTLNLPSSQEGGDFNQFNRETDQFDRALDVAFRQGAVGFSVDDFMEIFVSPVPTHVKIDVDGLEAAVLRGGRQTFAAPNVQSMIVEIENNLPSRRREEILSLMGELGFAPRKALPRYQNVIFDRH